MKSTYMYFNAQLCNVPSINFRFLMYTFDEPLHVNSSHLFMYFRFNMQQINCHTAVCILLPNKIYILVPMYMYLLLCDIDGG